MQLLLLLLCTLLINFIPTAGQAVVANLQDEFLIHGANVSVSAQANIFAIGQTTSPQITGKSGLPPTIINLPNIHSLFLHFPEITGQITCCGTDETTFNDADGGDYGSGATLLSSANSLMGLRHDHKTMFLAGVFTNSTLSLNAENHVESTLFDFTDRTHFASFLPALNQVFFIGDGHDEHQQHQTFIVPAGATQLALGFIENATEDSKSGQLGTYEDNQGELQVNFEVYLLSDRTDLPQPPELYQDLLAYYPFDDDLMDKVNINSSLYLPALLVYGQYYKALQSTNSLYNSLTGEWGFTLNREAWSIGAWFFQPAVYPKDYAIITVDSNTCQSSPWVIKDNQLGSLICQPEMETTEFKGSGLMMGDLSEGWYHLTIVANQGQTSYYINGQLVGTIAQVSDSPLNSIGHESIPLDEFRIYSRALSDVEIRLLAEVEEEFSSLLPTLGPGHEITGQNGTESPQATFAGGAAVNGQAPQREVIQNLTDPVEVKGEIIVDPMHIGQEVDIIVYAETTVPWNAEVLYFMLGEGLSIQLWDQNSANLIPFLQKVTLSAKQTVPMYQGTFYYPGTLRVFFGYRLSDGRLIQSNEPIMITING